MVRKKSLADLESWLGRARSSLVASFANGVIKDQAAVSAAITLPWSNGQTEGQITKLKLVKRQMYGRGKLDLLQARGRPAASFARRLLLPVSKDTLLRVVRRRGSPRFLPPTVIGIDDWAWRRNQRYGTIICDLERRKTIALLPDREPATAQDWLSGAHQSGSKPRIRGRAGAEDHR
jgi:transposase